MIPHALVAVALLSAPVRERPWTVGGVTLAAPTEWNHSESGGTHRFAAPDGEAWLEVDAGAVQTAGMSAEACLQKIKKGVGLRFEDHAVAGSPAAVSAVVDRDKAGNEFVSETWVGCNGRVTWSVTTHRVKKSDKWLAALARAMESLVYAGKGR